jgi:hypothetical protein
MQYSVDRKKLGVLGILLITVAFTLTMGMVISFVVTAYSVVGKVALENVVVFRLSSRVLLLFKTFFNVPLFIFSGSFIFC